MQAGLSTAVWTIVVACVIGLATYTFQDVRGDVAVLVSKVETIRGVHDGLRIELTALVLRVAQIEKDVQESEQIVRMLQVRLAALERKVPYQFDTEH